MMELWFMWFITFWTALLVAVMFIGGYFMFRKFLKRLPKEDGKSILDWEDHFLKETLHLWPNDKKVLLEELVEPVPEIFRDVARNKIAGKIGELALEDKATEITEELLVRGYILATPKRDHRFLKKKLKQKEIDIKQYESLF
jgi:hypothetical protein